MDPKKNRRWVIAGLAAGAVVFLVMAGGEVTATGTRAASTTSADAVLAAEPGTSSGASADPGTTTPPRTTTAAPDGGAAADADTDTGTGSAGSDPGSSAGGGDVERSAVIDFLRQLLEALGISPEELTDNSSADNSSADGAARDEPDLSDRSGQSAAAATITIANFEFGQPITVAPGATVEVLNSDAAPHNVTATDGSFATENIGQDETATFTAPTRPGRYEFTCTLHAGMTGTLIVQSGAGGAGRTAAPGTNGTGPTNGTGNNATDDAEPTQAPRTSTGHGSGNGY